MKIRIKNIFINKKTNDNLITNKDIHKKEKDSKNLNNIKNRKYKNLKLKKVYDASIIKYKEEEVEHNIKKEITSQENQVRVRKGYINNVKEEVNTRKEPKIKIYYNNLIKNKNKLSKGYYVLLVGMFILGIGSVTLATKTYNLVNQEDYQVFNSIDNDETINAVNQASQDSNVETQSNETSNKDTITDVEKKETEVVNNSNTVTSKNTEKKNTSTNTQVQVKPLEFSKPVEGEILKVYSVDKVIYSKTLELWKTHDGIDIKAAEGEYIKSIERGTVEKVYEDSFYGITIVIDHGQGYKSSYSNLDKDTLVNEKQTIIKGQKIGKIGKTAIGEIKDESHLHFMLFKDGVSQDPTNIFS